MNDVLRIVLPVLAIAGCLALLNRLVRSAARLGLAWMESTAAAGLAEVSERRGDITGLMERRQSEQGIRRNRRKEVVVAAGYLLLLLVPPLAGVAREVYAAGALLWVLPKRRIVVSESLRQSTRADRMQQ
ncbi:MAG TPA: hypothetical protein VGB24_19880 [Longimicrobium sp.]|jgi:hypothetical protein|uniref:hypothetical protein n=1 Tax=Longimicrobium sp. TaxID=2029185 RepID=UPI002EDAAAB2